MANPEHIEILRQGVEVWNDWRKNSRDMNPDLTNANLMGVDLTGADLTHADLSHADLTDAVLIRAHLILAHLHRADLIGANLNGANVRGAKFTEANLHRAHCNGTDLQGANLQGANLSEVDFGGAVLSQALLHGADLNQARLYETIFGNTDLSRANHLDSCNHLAPCILDHRTLAQSGKLPLSFLRGCGLPDTLIEFLPSLLSDPIQFYSCFISYSHRDEDFAQRLYSQMRSAGLQVWYAPEEMKGGRKLHEQIFGAIHVHDKLLLVLSENSLRSEWVATEIRRARKAEGEEGRRKLFPIRLVDFEAIRAWECFDADTGKDLGVELREYFIPDFSDWKDHDAFEKAFERLLRDLKAEEPAKPTYIAPDSLENRAVLSPRDTIREGWKGVESSVIQAAMLNGLVSEEERVDCGLLINRLHEAGKISDEVRGEYFLLSKWHRSVDFDSFSSVEPQTAINFVKRARELQKALAVDTPPLR